MSGYLEGVLVLLAINVVYAYAAFLPIAAGQAPVGALRRIRSNFSDGDGSGFFPDV